MNKEAKNIIECSRDLFLQRGFRNVTMDDIAQEMKISKKTIYKHFSDKKALIEVVVSIHLVEMQTFISATIQDKRNAIEQMQSISSCLSELKKSVQPSIFFELEKYFASAFKLINDHRENFVKQIIIENIERGKKEGLYRDNIEPVFIASLYMSATNHLIESGLISNTDFSTNALQQFFEYHLRGISTLKGIELLNSSKSIL